MGVHSQTPGTLASPSTVLTASPTSSTPILHRTTNSSDLFPLSPFPALLGRKHSTRSPSRALISRGEGLCAFAFAFAFLLILLLPGAYCGSSPGYRQHSRAHTFARLSASGWYVLIAHSRTFGSRAPAHSLMTGVSSPRAH